MDNNSTYIEDILFEFRVKMLDYIESDVCLTTDLSECVVPNIDYIPDWSTWIPPTPAPTTPGFTCDKVLEEEHQWSGVIRFNERQVGDSYREQWEENGYYSKGEQVKKVNVGQISLILNMYMILTSKEEINIKCFYML